MEIIDHDSISAEYDSLRWFLFSNENAEIVLEEVFCIEFGIQLKLFIYFGEFGHTVEGEDSKFTAFSVAFADKVPSLVEEFQAIRLDEGGVGLGIAEFLIAHLEDMMGFDGLDDGFEMLQSCGDVFKKKLVLDGEAVHEQAVDGEGSQHPILGGVVAECFGIADVILVLVVAFDANTKHIFDGLT